MADPMDGTKATMTTRDAALAWRLFEANWIPIGAMCVAFALVLAATDFSFTLGSAAFSFGFVAVYGGFAYYNAHTPHRRDPQVVFALGTTAQIVLITVVMTPMTYAAAALNLPLQDALLDHLDRAMGLDWRAYLAFVNDHGVVRTALNIGYGMIRWPIFIIPVALVLVRDYRRLQEFTLAFALALIVTTIVSALVPAIGTFYHLHLTAADYANINPAAYLEQLRDLPPVRDGSLRRLDLLALTGLVTFPSFHAASAVLYVWALWPVRWLRGVALVSNATMLAATPIHGGHYFVDVIAGVAVAAAGIVAARWVSRRIEALQSWALGFTLRPWRPRQEESIQSTS
jgi:PAP2 superfamily